jgi:dGTPase
MGAMYSRRDRARVVRLENEKDDEPYRSAWRRDYARLIHSPSFRRLQGKTQVFPGYESDFFRNRLTHSLEVAQIAKSLAMRLNATAKEFKKAENALKPEIVEFAGLAHDLGHPPFGHTGEEALDECMRDYGGFEGNAQTLRIGARLEKKSTIRTVQEDTVPFDNGEDLRCGLNLTFRSLASLLKYDNMIAELKDDRRVSEGVEKGYCVE